MARTIFIKSQRILNQEEKSKLTKEIKEKTGYEVVILDPGVEVVEILVGDK